VKNGMEQPLAPKHGMAIRVALIAVLAAMAIGGNYALSAIPNVELSSVMVFLSGFLFGPFIGAFVGLIAMSVYQLWNPWGGFYPPIGIAVIGCTILIGIIGGIIGRALKRLAYTDNRWLLLPSLFGILLTLFFDLITNFAYSVSLGPPFIVTIATGFPFMVVHVVNNAILFGLLTKPVSRAVDHLNLNQIQQHRDRIKAK
jgi:LytS/YehU family sensor histidine kinase